MVFQEQQKCYGWWRRYKINDLTCKMLVAVHGHSCRDVNIYEAVDAYKFSDHLNAMERRELINRLR